MIQGIIIVTVVLFVLAMFLLYRVQVLASIVKGDDEDDRENATNNWMGLLLFAFFTIGTIAMFYYGFVYWDDMMIPIASEHGVELDTGFWVSMGFIIAAMVITNFLLLFFAYISKSESWNQEQ